jgi:hypothetical protein
MLKVTANGSVLPKAGYSVFRQPIPKLIYFQWLKITFCCPEDSVTLITEDD